MSQPRTRGKISVSVSAGIASVEINNPAQRNALTRSMCLELQEAMPRLDADPQVDIVVLTGSGGTFSAGATIDELPAVLMDRQDDGTTIDQLSRADQAITSMAKPTLALVKGACMGGGWQIASACDFIIASADSTFAITPAKIGIIYPRPGIERLVRQVGPANAKFILFTAEVLTGVRAMELGLVTEVVADVDFASRCDSIIETLRKRSRFSMHYLKRLVDMTAVCHPEISREWEDAWTAMTQGPDMEIGVKAFLNREQPEFTWSPTT